MFSKNDRFKLAGQSATFVVPPNIRLIKYVSPDRKLTSAAARFIMTHLAKCNVVADTTLYHGFAGGKIFRDELTVSKSGPGTRISNMELIFDDSVPGFGMGVQVVRNGVALTLNKPSTVHSTLESVLSWVSDMLRKDGVSGVVDVHQLTCQAFFHEAHPRARRPTTADGRHTDVDLHNVTAIMQGLSVSDIPLMEHHWELMSAPFVTDTSLQKVKRAVEQK